MKVPIILALIFWSIIALFLISEALLTNMELHPQSLIGLSFFLYLFGNRLRYYSQQMILVDMDGLIIMESGKLEAFSWNEVVGVERRLLVVGTNDGVVLSQGPGRSRQKRG